MGTFVKPQSVAPNPPEDAKIIESSLLAQENRLLAVVQQYMSRAEVEQVSGKLPHQRLIVPIVARRLSACKVLPGT